MRRCVLPQLAMPAWHCMLAIVNVGNCGCLCSSPDQRSPCFVTIFEHSCHVVHLLMSYLSCNFELD